MAGVWERVRQRFATLTMHKTPFFRYSCNRFLAVQAPAKMIRSALCAGNSKMESRREPSKGLSTLDSKIFSTTIVLWFVIGALNFFNIHDYRAHTADHRIPSHFFRFSQIGPFEDVTLTGGYHLFNITLKLINAMYSFARCAWWHLFESWKLYPAINKRRIFFCQD